MSVVEGDVAVDIADEFAHAAERAAPDRLMGDEREPTLDLIKPTRVGGSVMKMEARMACEPGLDPWVLVSRVVVGDQVQLEFGRDSVVEVVEKSEKLLMPMPRFALRDDRTVEHVECAKSVVVPCR